MFKQSAAARQHDVRGLQRLALTADIGPVRRGARRSRAAQLAAIDLLSRWSAAGLALIAGLGVYLAATVGRAYPTRAAAWSVMLLGALWACRRLQARFRAGEAISATPFRWRASFAACLSVLGVAFASAPILLTPLDAPTHLAMQATLLALVGAFAAALFFLPHRNCLVALAAPGAALPMLATLRAGDGVSAGLMAIAASAGVVALFTLHRYISRKLLRQHPRTNRVRTESARNEAAPAPSRTIRQRA